MPREHGQVSLMFAATPALKVLATSWGNSFPNVERYARSLREADSWPSGVRGRRGSRVTVKHLSALLLSQGTEVTAQALIVVGRLGPLRAGSVHEG